LTLGEAGLPIVALATQYADPGSKPYWGNTEPTDDWAHVAVLKAVARADSAQLSPAPKNCRSVGFVGPLICGDRFGEFLDALNKDTAAVRTIRMWGQQSPCKEDRTVPKARACMAERGLADLITKPEITLYQMTANTLRRLRGVEDLRSSEKSKNSKLIARTLEAAYYSNAARFHRGMEFDPSTIPGYEGKSAWGMMHILPYYVGGTLGASGAVIGWQPTWNLPWPERDPLGPVSPGSLALVAPTEMIHVPQTAPRAVYRRFVAVSPSIAIKRNSFTVPQIQVGARYTTQWHSWAQRKVDGRLHFEAAAALFGSKLRLSVFRMRTIPNDRLRTMGTVSLSDVNGLLYWMFRSTR
jgi:hypothetical protein